MKITIEIDPTGPPRLNGPPKGPTREGWTIPLGQLSAFVRLARTAIHVEDAIDDVIQAYWPNEYAYRRATRERHRP